MTRTRPSGWLLFGLRRSKFIYFLCIACTFLIINNFYRTTYRKDYSPIAPEEYEQDGRILPEVVPPGPIDIEHDKAPPSGGYGAPDSQLAEDGTVAREGTKGKSHLQEGGSASRFKNPVREVFIHGRENALSNVDRPFWDPARPLPAWYVETQEFIKRMESEDRPYPFFEKFLSFDIQVWLGLNNLRYMLEMSNSYGVLLNRTVIIPGKIYARSCLQYELCRLTGNQENIAENTDQYFGRWALDFDTFWDVEGMRKTLNVITAFEFNRVMMVKHGIIVEDPEEWVATQGGDLRMPRAMNLFKIYHDIDPSISVESQPILTVLYDTRQKGVIYVDDVEPLTNKGQPIPGADYSGSPRRMDMWVIQEKWEMSINNTLEETYELPLLQDVEESQAKGSRRWQWKKDGDVPDAEARQRGTIPVGFKQYFETPATILHFQEGVHGYGRVPYRFSTPEGRARYEHIVTDELPYSKTLRDARDYLLAKLLAKLENPSYVGFHYRLGDFVGYAWAQIEEHSIVAQRMIYGTWLHGQRKTGLACEINRDSLPEVDVNNRRIKSLPFETMRKCTDKNFYFATDEITPKFLNEMRKIGGICIFDLMDEEFVEKYLHVSAFGDYLGVLDQWLLANANVFVGAPMSSVTGGVLNMRKRLGKPLNSNVLMSEVKESLERMSGLR